MKNAGAPKRLSIGFDPELSKQIDAHLERLQKQSPDGATVTVTDAIRNLVVRGLKNIDRVERDRGRAR